MAVPTKVQGQSVAQDTAGRRIRANGMALRVGPEILVSRDHSTPHVELMATANPRDPLNLLVGAITMTGPDGGPATKTYASLDGGQSWHDSRFPEQRRWGGADPQVVFTPRGTAIFSTLATAQDEEGRSRGFLHAYRSEDGGISWSQVQDLAYSWDHPQMVVDHTDGPFAGRIYMGVLHGYPVYTVSIFRSEDNGRSWLGPEEAANGGGALGINVVTPLVLSDGMLVVPYVDFEFMPERRIEGQETSLWAVTSSDGGLTFSEPQLVATRRFNGEGGYGGFPQLAADATSGPFRDRIYAAWTDHQGPEPRILVSWSEDRGGHWSEPALVDLAAPQGTYQFQPALAVNQAGVVGLTWFDTRDEEGGDRFNQYFSASLEGGEQWLPPLRVSTASSYRYAPGNLGFTPQAWRLRDESLRISFLSPGARWSTGGDYMALTTDAAGAFRAFWTDSRYGSYQIMTTTIEVDERPTAVEPSQTAEVDLSDDVEVAFDPSRYDAATRILSLQVRIRNTSERTILGTLRIVVRKFGSGQGGELVEYSPRLLNAANGLPGEGAQFEFSSSLGSDGVLLPGEISSPLEIRLELQDPLRVPDMHVDVLGAVVLGR